MHTPSLFTQSCLSRKVVDLVANETGTELVQVTAEDIEANGSCAAE